MAKQKMVTVNIRCSQVMYYNQTKEMLMADFEKLKECDGDEVMECGNREQYSLLQEYINPHDVFDTLNQFENFSISLKK